MIIHAPAKINLTLDILGAAPNGYHYIQTILHEVPTLFDELDITTAPDNELLITSSLKTLPCDERNTVYNALTLAKKSFSDIAGFKVDITKNIPVAGGLGGGSSDAVAALKAAAILYKLDCCILHTSNLEGVIHSSECPLRTISIEVGSDCAFFWDGGTQYATHFGEVLQQLPILEDLDIEIIPTGIPVSTSEAYQLINSSTLGQKTVLTQDMLDAIIVGDPSGIVKNLHNDFEDVIFEKFPKILEVKKQHEKTPGRILLCGSGGSLTRINGNC